MSVTETIYIQVEKTSEEVEEKWIDVIRCECTRNFHLKLYDDYLFPDGKMWEEFGEHVRKTGHNSFQMFVRK